MQVELTLDEMAEILVALDKAQRIRLNAHRDSAYLRIQTVYREGIQAERRTVTLQQNR